LAGQDLPYAEDYYLGDYKECNWDYNNPSGVCPDYVYTGAKGNSSSNSLLHGQQTDGLSLSLHAVQSIRHTFLFNVGAVGSLYALPEDHQDQM
jgi:hypothetical protein